jgi:uncharacterized lipoprotein
MMSVLEIVNQVRTLSQAEQSELFVQLHKLEESAKFQQLEQVLVNQYAGHELEHFTPVLTTEDLDYIMNVLEVERGELNVHHN